MRAPSPTPTLAKRRQPTHGQRHQGGITLILVLIFTVSLAVIGVVGMRQVMTVERIATNDRDRSLAFQAAESAIREAVAKINANTAASLATGYYTTPRAAGGNVDFWRTQTTSLTENTDCSNDTTFTKRFKWSGCSANAAATSQYKNLNAPQYVIEVMPTVPATNGLASGTESWYRVTARATGGTNQADVILQVMYCDIPAGQQSASPTCR